MGTPGKPTPGAVPAVGEQVGYTPDPGLLRPAGVPAA